jgi:histidinol phosphatase-like enzyme
VSNQGGVSSGRTTLEIAEGALATTARRLFELGAKVDYFDFAEAEDEFRKPGIGMATKLEEVLRQKCGKSFDRAASQMIGDSGYKKEVDGPHPDGRPADDFSNADRLFAENVGVKFAEPTDAFGWRRFGVFNVLGETELVPFLAKIEAEAQRLRQSGDAEGARALDEEVTANRRVNGLRR